MCVGNRLRTTLREPGGEPMSIWRIQSTTPDGSLNTSWEKVGALFKKRHMHGVNGRQRGKYGGGGEAEGKPVSSAARNKTASEFLPWSTGHFLSYKVSLVIMLHYSSFKAKNLLASSQIPTESLNYT